MRILSYRRLLTLGCPERRWLAANQLETTPPISRWLTGGLRVPGVLVRDPGDRTFAEPVTARRVSITVVQMVGQGPDISETLGVQTTAFER